MDKDRLFLNYLESGEEDMGHYAKPFHKENRDGIRDKFFEKAGVGAPFEPYIQKKKSKKGLFRLWIAAALIFCLFTGAVAFGVIDLTSLIDLVGGRIGTQLQPIGLISEHEGIRMKTLAAMNDDDMVYIYLTLTDLWGERIDETLDIYDYFVSQAPALNCQVINYDENSKTATLRMSGSGGKELTGRKITVSINSFLSGAKKTKGFETGLDLYTLLENGGDATIERVGSHEISGGSGEFTIDRKREGEDFLLLKRDEKAISLPGLDWLTLSNIGFVEGKLHIQINPDSDMGRFNHGNFYFVDTNGDSIYCTNTVAFGKYKQGETTIGGDYLEYIFDISTVNQLEGLKLMASFTTYDQYVEGRWENTFTLEAIAESKEVDTDLPLKRGSIKKITVSPLGITLNCLGDPDIKRDGEGGILPADIEMTLQYEGGKSVGPYTVICHIEPGEFNIKYLPPDIIDVEKVESITVDGETIKIK